MRTQRQHHSAAEGMMERRAFLAAALIAPVAIATPAIAQALVCHAADPVDEFWSAFHAYDEDDPTSEERLIASNSASVNSAAFAAAFKWSRMMTSPFPRRRLSQSIMVVGVGSPIALHSSSTANRVWCHPKRSAGTPASDRDGR
jgi:hypothetical protein